MGLFYALFSTASLKICRMILMFETQIETAPKQCQKVDYSIRITLHQNSVEACTVDDIPDFLVSDNIIIVYNRCRNVDHISSTHDPEHIRVGIKCIPRALDRNQFYSDV